MSHISRKCLPAETSRAGRRPYTRVIEPTTHLAQCSGRGRPHVSIKRGGIFVYRTTVYCFCDTFSKVLFDSKLIECDVVC